MYNQSNKLLAMDAILITKQRRLREKFWMKELRTIFPYGLNDRCDGMDWIKKEATNITASIFNKIVTKRKSRGSGKLNWSKVFSVDNFLKEVTHHLL